MLDLISKSIAITTILLCSTLASGQQDGDLEIVKADLSWRKEIILFPIDWAPEMTLDGFEELYFSPGWGQPESPQFWSYIMAWKVNTNKPLTLEQISWNLERYFDGLMKPNHWSTDFPEPKVELDISNEVIGHEDFIGKMEFFDGFHTGKPLVTNILIDQWFCEVLQRATVILRFSPQSKDHQIWKELLAFAPIDSACPDE